MESYSLTYSYKSVLGGGFFGTSREAKLADLDRAILNFHEAGVDGAILQIQTRKGPAFEAAKALAALIDDSETMTEGLKARHDAEREAWWRDYQAKEAAKAAEASAPAIADLEDEAAESIVGESSIAPGSAPSTIPFAAE